MIPLRDINPIRTRPVVTYLLIAVNAAVYLYQSWLSYEVERVAGPEAAEKARQLFAHQWGLVPYYLTQPEHIAFGSFETPFTSMFLHGGWVHLISNMWFLHIFGDNVEDTLGRFRFLLFYLACGLAAAVAQVAIDPSSEIPMIGASGAISGVLAAYFMLFPHARVVTLIPVFVLFFIRELPAVFFIVIWFGMQLLSGIGSLGMGQQTGGVAFFAHIGGFLGGLWLLRALGFSRNRTRGFRRAESGYPRVDPYQRGKD